MSTDAIGETPSERLHWAIRESFVIAGVLLFWVGIGAVLLVIASLLRVALHVVGLRSLRVAAELLERSAILWPAFWAVATATVGLYVVVRAGTLLIDHYRTSEG